MMPHMVKPSEMHLQYEMHPLRRSRETTAHNNDASIREALLGGLVAVRADARLHAASLPDSNRALGRQIERRVESLGQS